MARSRSWSSIISRDLRRISDGRDIGGVATRYCIAPSDRLPSSETARSVWHLINKHFDGPKVPCEVARVSIRLGELSRCDLRIVLRCSWSCMPKPLLQLKQSQRFLRVEKLRCNHGAGAMVSDVASNARGRPPSCVAPGLEPCLCGFCR
jgi:hypothetical protein